MPSSSTRAKIKSRPFYDLIHQVACLKSDGTAPDFAASPAELLESIARSAETALQTAQLGVRAAGELVALSAPDTEAEDWPSSTLEAIGWLIAELSDVAAVCHCLQATCLANLPPAKRQQLTKPRLFREEPFSPLA